MPKGSLSVGRVKPSLRARIASQHTIAARPARNSLGRIATRKLLPHLRKSDPTKINPTPRWPSKQGPAKEKVANHARSLGNIARRDSPLRARFSQRVCEETAKAQCASGVPAVPRRPPWGTRKVIRRSMPDAYFY